MRRDEGVQHADRGARSLEVGTNPTEQRGGNGIEWQNVDGGHERIDQPVQPLRTPLLRAEAKLRQRDRLRHTADGASAVRFAPAVP